MSAQEPTDLKLGRPLKVEAQSVDTALTDQEQTALAVEASPVKTTDAANRLTQLQELVKTQHDVLMAQRSSHKLEFDQAREWLGKLDSVEANLVRLNLMIDVVNKDITAANKQRAEHIDQGSAKQVQQLEATGAHLLEIISQLEQETQQHHSVETEATDEYPVAVAGAMKSAWSGSDELKEGKLGKFGQDVILIDRSKRIGVVADGTSSLEDSYEIAKRVAHQSELLLQNVDETEFTLEEIKFFLQGQLGEILANLDTVDQKLNGSCAVLAARYFEKFDAVVMIDLGDCEAVIRVGSKTIPINNYIVESTTLNYHFRKIAGRPAVLDNPGETNVVHSVSLADLRNTYPDTPIHLLLSTDGLKNNSGKRLQDQSGEVVERGVRAVVEQFKQRKDDITIIDMDLSLPAVEQRVEQQQAVG